MYRLAAANPKTLIPTPKHPPLPDLAIAALLPIPPPPPPPSPKPLPPLNLFFYPLDLFIHPLDLFLHLVDLIRGGGKGWSGGWG